MTSPPLRNDHTTANMAAHDIAQQETTSRFTSVNGYLITPPEKFADSFSQEERPQEAPKEWETKLAPLHERTPPTSPDERTLPSIASATGYAVIDAPLFPERRTERARSETPLFETDRSSSIPRSQSAPGGGDAIKSPVLSDIRTTLEPSRPSKFAPLFGVKDERDALDYYHSRINELRVIQKARLPSPKKSRSPARDEFDNQQLRRLNRSAGITKSRPVPKPVSKPKASAAASLPERPSPPKRRTPKARTTSDFLNDAWPAAQPAKHKRAPPSKKVEHDNVNWSELPDYAPSITTLDSSGKTLKATWHGTPVDLSNDIDRANLHPQELNVAATLRLSCAQYLSNKRKIFQGRMQALKDGKNFTKTAAQGACSIDVNKASQLWEAFERVGWFKESLFDKYL
jgi:hypothetical protein